MIHKIHTACRDCVFQTYNDLKCITQIGCWANCLKAFKNNNVEIMEAYDEEKEFYIINGQKCLYKRTKNWPKYSENPKGMDILMDLVRTEIELKYQVIVVGNNSLDDIQNTLNSIIRQTLLPRHISLIRGPDNPIRPTVLVDILKNTKIKWRLQNRIDLAIGINNNVDIIMDFIPHPYYMVVNAGFTLPSDTFKIISDKFISRELQCLALLPNEDGNGFFTSHKVHKMCQGNKSISLISKLTQDELCQPLLKKITEVVPNFPV